MLGGPFIITTASDAMARWIVNYVREISADYCEAKISGLAEALNT